MKILAFGGRNLASLPGEWALRLDDGPLAEAGTFAITGPTGAGKTTLFDALCLALWGQTPRYAEVGPRPHDLSSDGRDPLTSRDPRGVLRWGEREGNAWVELRDRQGGACTATWTVAREPRGGKIETKRYIVRTGTGEVLAERKKDVRDWITAHLGLDFGQFCRSVLLPQGDFAAFLGAKGAERAALLERMTDTAIYGRIGQRVHEVAKEARSQLDTARVAHEAIAVLSPQEHEACVSAIATLRNEEALARETHRAALAAQGWFVRDVELAALEAEAAALEAQHSTAWAEAAGRVEALAVWQRAEALRAPVGAADAAANRRTACAERVRVATAEAEEAKGAAAAAREPADLADAAARAARAARDEAAPILREARALDARISEADARLAAARSRSEAAARRAGEARAERDAARSVLAQRLDALSTAEAALADAVAIGELAPSWPLWAARLGELDAALVALAVAGPAVRIAQAEAQAAEIEATSARSRHETVEATRAAYAAERDTAVLAAEAAPLGPAHAARLAAHERRQRLEDRQRLALAAAALDARAAHCRDEAAAASVEAAESGQLAAEAAAAQADAMTRRDELALLQASAQREAAVADHRPYLRDGEPCPLCGAREHPYADAAPPSGLLADLGARIEFLDRSIERHREDAARQRAATAAARDRAAERAADAEAADRDAAAIRAEGPDALDAAALAVEAAGVEAAARDAELAVRLAEAARDRLDAAAAAERKSDSAARAAAESAGAAAERASHAKRAAQEAERTLAEAETKRQAAERELGPVARWPNAALRPAELAEALGVEVRAWEAAVLARDGGRREVDAARLALAAADRLAELRDGEARLERQAVDAAREELEPLREARMALLPGEPADAVEERLLVAVRRAEAAARSASEAAELAARHLSGRTAALDEARAHAEHAALEADAAIARRDAACAEAGLELSVARHYLARPTAAQEDERRALSALESDARAARAALAARRSDRLAHTASRPSADAAGAEEAVATAESRLREATQALAVSQKVLADDDRARERRAVGDAAIAPLEARSALCERLRVLIGDAEGRRFRLFAQAMTLDRVLLLSNRHLDRLAPRYRLQRAPGSDLELEVVDRDHGDDVRSVASLSGGELFLASLALALGLASLSTGAARLGSLFIDEGFGSLDAASLETVAGVLQALQRDVGTVAVITHADALAEQLGAVVRVERVSATRSVVRLPG